MTLTLMTQSLKWKVMQNEMKLPYADESEVHENWNESLDMSNWLRIWTQDEIKSRQENDVDLSKIVQLKIQFDE